MLYLLTYLHQSCAKLRMQGLLVSEEPCQPNAFEQKLSCVDDVVDDAETECARPAHAMTHYMTSLSIILFPLLSYLFHGPT